ncbi:MAG: hypothetical protein PS018_09945 [bacterium]|nr:hypothetical protein [bacterium]
MTEVSSQASECVIALAQLLTGKIQGIDQKWLHAFLRIDAEEGAMGARCSYVNANGVHLVGPIENQDLYHRAIEIGEQLRAATHRHERAFKVCLLIVDASFNYELKFEYEDASKWMITKLDGATGIPVGITAADLAALDKPSPPTTPRRPWYRFW